MLEVVLPGVRVNADVIQVRDTESAEEGAKNFLHETSEHRWSDF